MKYIVLLARKNKFVMGHEEIRYAGQDGEVEEYVYRAGRFDTREEAQFFGARTLEALGKRGNWKMEIIRYGS